LIFVACVSNSDTMLPGNWEIQGWDKAFCTMERELVFLKILQIAHESWKFVKEELIS
jgi:hypothetical protein